MKRGSSRPASASVTFDTWGPPPPLEAGISPAELFGGLPVQPLPKAVHCDGTEPWDIPWLASWGLYPQLYALGSLLRPTSLLEIGTLYGHGACAVIRGAMGSIRRVDVLDNESYFGGGYLASARLNLEVVLAESYRRWLHQYPDEQSKPVLNVWSHDTATGLPYDPKERLPKFDLVLVDGDHSYAGKLRDLALAWAVTLPGAHLYVDDVHSMPEVRRAVQDFVRDVDVPSVLELFTRTTDRPRGAYLIERGA